MNTQPQTTARPVTPTTQVDDMNNPKTFTDKKLVASATKSARPRYSRVTHKAIGSKQLVNRAPVKKTVAPGKTKLPFIRSKS